jgi:hypothetical protein
LFARQPAGNDADMTSKSEFNAEEWSQVVEAPALAAVRVITADRGGTIRESMSLGKVYAEARQGADSGLLHEVASSPPQIDPQRGQELLGPAGLDRLRQTIALVEGKTTPEEAQQYRDFIVRVADTAARAHKEGGFLGIGGKEVSEREQAVLDEVTEAVRPG